MTEEQAERILLRARQAYAQWRAGDWPEDAEIPFHPKIIELDLQDILRYEREHENVG